MALSRRFASVDSTPFRKEAPAGAASREDSFTVVNRLPKWSDGERLFGVVPCGVV
jgi:hypothetical protein